MSNTDWAFDTYTSNSCRKELAGQERRPRGARTQRGPPAAGRGNSGRRLRPLQQVQLGRFRRLQGGSETSGTWVSADPAPGVGRESPWVEALLQSAGTRPCSNTTFPAFFTRPLAHVPVISLMLAFSPRPDTRRGAHAVQTPCAVSRAQTGDSRAIGASSRFRAGIGRSELESWLCRRSELRLWAGHFSPISS